MYGYFHRKVLSLRDKLSPLNSRLSTRREEEKFVNFRKRKNANKMYAYSSFFFSGKVSKNSNKL